MIRHPLACTCSPTCKARHARYEKRRHHLAATGRPLLVASHGAVRRVQALVAAGWTLAEVAAAGGLPLDTVRSLLRTKAPTITRRAADRIAYGYDQLCEQPDPLGRYATRNRSLAARRGWPPPEAWAADQLDLEDGQPWTERGQLDYVLLQRMLDGEPQLGRELHWSERLRLIDAWQAAGRSLAELERAGWNPYRDRRLYADRQAT